MSSLDISSYDADENLSKNENIISSAPILSQSVFDKTGPDKDKFQILEEKALSISDQKEKAYIQRLLRMVKLPDLSRQANHPIKQIVDRILRVKIYEEFDIILGPEIVSIEQTFNNFNFPLDHVARRRSDTYYVEGNEFEKDSLILRPHISVMRDALLKESSIKGKLETKGVIGALSRGKVYRVDDVDATHHQVFHQIDGLKISKKTHSVITKDDLKNILIENVKAIFGDNIEYQIRDDHFPYTENSMEIDVLYHGEWLEILGSGTVHPKVLSSFGLDPNVYNGWAFGMGIERIAMPIKKIPDIRIFWSDDSRITNQRGTLNKPFEEVSKFPSTTRDFSIIVAKDYEEREITELMRDSGKELIEKIEKVDERDGKGKFGENNKSVSYKATFRSIDRTLTNEEINEIYFEIREKINSELGLTLR